MKWITNLFKRKKSGVPKNENPPPPPDPLHPPGTMGIYINGKFVAALTPYEMEMPDPPYPVTIVRSLDDLLEMAIESENYEEAARIRDLINKK